MNYMAPDFPPKSAERTLSRRARRTLNSAGLLLGLAEKHRQLFEVKDEAPDGFRDDLLILANDEADQLWPAGNGFRNSEVAENVANACGDFYWAEACEIMRKNSMAHSRAVQSVRRLKQDDIDGMSSVQQAELEDMVEHVDGLLMFASRPKDI
ncbi:hypothetical protein GXW78_18215 [Roseomonas terrae]|uniref:Uncharacterized protein n=1 Tax=Neoroseomonas terrae TaxID=424799 RepID=A0ABS5EKQ5_9PROT|nr:hypothetical protein [Neoroseomonas terrae]MBR0651611.1 hypothetical protein [Neoroseomonas terrae]